MNSFKKITHFISSFFLVVVILIGGIYINNAYETGIVYASETEPTLTGACGENISWEFFEATGEIVLKGHGDMPSEFRFPSDYEWYSFSPDIKKVTICDGITNVGVYAFGGTTGILDDSRINYPNIDSVYLAGSVSEISGKAFSFSFSDSFSLSGCEGVKIIGDNAFAHSNIAEYPATNSLEEIGKSAFLSCDRLTSFYIPTSLKSISTEYNPFSDCSLLTEFCVAEDNEYYRIFEGALVSSDNKTIIAYPCNNSKKIFIFPDSITEMAVSAFSDSVNLEKVVLSDGITTIPKWAFMGCTSLKDISIGNKVSQIDESAFENCSSLTYVYIPSSVKTLADYVFYGCSALKYITMENGLETIGEKAFYETAVENIIIPSSVTAINKGAFGQCLSLKKIFIPTRKCEIYDSRTTIYGGTIYGVSRSNAKSYASTYGLDFVTITDAPQLTGINVSASPNKTQYYKGESFVKDGLVLCLKYGDDMTTYINNGFDIVVEEFTATGTETVAVLYGGFSDDILVEVVPRKFNLTLRSGSSYSVVSYFEGDEIAKPDNPEMAGYDFAGWNPEIPQFMPENDLVVEASWIARTDTPYTVEIYEMDDEGIYLKTIETKKGQTDSEVSVAYLPKEGFSLNSQKSVESGVVSAEEPLVLKVYFDRITYTLTTVVDGVSTPATYLYGAKVSEPVIPMKSGYKFIKWDGTIPETMPAENVTVTAVFEKCYICPDCGEEILGKEAIDAHIAAEAKMKAKIKIKNNNGSKTINYGETLRLTASVTDMPADTAIYWFIDGVKKGEGEIFNVSFESGTKTVEVKLVDSSGNVLKNASGNEIKDSESVTVKAGFFQKLISFFKNLFGSNRTVIQSIKDLF